MNWIERQQIANELFEHTEMTREQYRTFCKLADELDLELIESYKDEKTVL